MRPMLEAFRTSAREESSLSRREFAELVETGHYLTQMTKEEMLASTERGIWVTRFHYTNPVHPVKAVLTGMTRDGTFLIENGQIVRPLKNLRFTQSILEAFDRAEMLGSELKMIGRGSFASCVPAAKIHEFRFTGTTEF